MDTPTFLGRVTAPGGYYCILALGPKKGMRTQKFYPTASAAIHAAENFDANGRDAYFALGKFASPGSREAADVSDMKALYLDIDCGPTKDYPDQATGLRALRDFVKFAKLPKPIIVNSGRGLHVYWPLEAAVPVAAWLPVALRLKGMCRALGLKTDTTATTDAARVLRLPGTHNYKDDPANEVTVLVDGPDTPLAMLDAVISKHAPATPAGADGGGLFGDAVSRDAERVIEKARAVDSTLDRLLGNFKFSFKKIARRTMQGKGCAQIASMLEDPASVSEPLWRAGLSIAARCEEPKAIHWISEGHPDYDPEDTEYKAKRTKGPYLCGKFDDLNPGVCDGCPLFGKIKSPVVIGKLVDESEGEVVTDPTPRNDPEELVEPPALGVIPAYPKPYARGKAGGVFIKITDEEGEVDYKPVWQNDIYVVRRLTDPEVGECIVMRHHLPRDGVRTFVVPLAVVTSKEEFRKVLAAQGVAAINKEVDALMAYTQTWVNALQNSTVATTVNRQFGWTGDFEGFLLGDRLITSKGEEFSATAASTRMLAEALTPKGTLEGWKDAMAFYNRPGFELHQFVVCAGFGSALMRFMPINAALLHLWSKDSGFGKTTVQYAALSVWGDPRRLILNKEDTYNSKMNRADVMHSLPVCMDEVTNMRPADASDMIYQITGGQQRNRMQASGNVERFRGDPWNLLFISSANCSLIDKVSMAKAMPKAEAQRVLEIEVSKLFSHSEDKEATDAFSRQLQENYGLAGAVFIEYVINNVDQVELLISTVQRQIDREARLGPENRFWSAAAATSIAAAVICHHLGLLPYDVKALRKYVIQNVLKVNQSASGEMGIDAMAQVTDYVYQHWGRFLQIRSTAGKAKHGNGLDNLVIPEQMPKSTDIAGRYEPDTEMLFILARPFRKWLSEQQMNFASVFAELQQHFGAKKMQVRVTRGTPMNLPAAESIVMKVSLGPPDAAGS